ncbi:MAG: site-specific DNA-methyltransferase [Parvibaculaceae bacterium]
MNDREASLEKIAIRDLKPWSRNARTHSKKQINQLAESIKTFGFTNPVLIDSENSILAGHGRVEAARQLKMDRIPCVRLENMTPAQKRAYVLADNKLALNAGWDDELLAEELQCLLEIDLDFDIGVLGFSIPEIDSLIEGLNPEEVGDPAEDQLPPLGGSPVISRLGDIWQLGPHRLMCGNALEAETYERLLNGARARMVFTDPPYNVAIEGNVGGLGAIKHREFLMASGEMSREQFTSFLKSSFRHLADFSIDGSIHFICMDWRHMSEILAAGEDVFSELKNLCVWAKDNGGMGTFYRSRHELVFTFKNGTAQHINSFELGQHGRYRTNVWEYKGVNTLRAGRMDELALHPTVKPVAMIADAIKDVSKRNDVVLDPFGGSGSTLIAAHKTGRRAYLAELDPIYVDRIIQRWQVFAHDDAVLIETGETFEEASRLRAAPQIEPRSRFGIRGRKAVSPKTTDSPSQLDAGEAS